jgi:hypothetical protein
MYIVCSGGNMPLLQVRDIYEEIKFEAKCQHRTIAQQTIVLIKDGLEKEISGQARRIRALERSRNRLVPEEAKDFDFVKSIREDRNR